MWKATGQSTLTISSLLVLLTLAKVTFGFAYSVAAEPNAATRIPDPFAVNKLIGRGINIGNALDAPSEGEWGVTLKEEYFDLVKQAGFNSIRLPVRWSAHAPNVPPYAIDPGFMKRVDWAVNNCLSRNLPVVLNIHNYFEFYNDPRNHKDKYLALWKQIAEHYKDYPDTLLFELLNEPQGKLRASPWNLLLKQALAIVRESNPNRTVVIGPANGNAIEYLKSLDIPKDDRNIIVTFHYYLPMKFTHQGAPWITDFEGEKSADSWVGTKWTGTEEEKQAVIKDFNVAAAWANQNNRPMNLGEFGAYNKADMESRARWTKFIADTAVQCGFSFDYWEFCAQEFGLYDQQTKSWRKPLLDALIPPKP